MNHFIVSAFCTFIPAFLVSIFFLFKKKTASSHILSLYWLSIALWSCLVSMQFHLLRFMPERIWGWFLHLGCIYIPIIFFHFATNYSRYPKKKIPLMVGYLIASLFVLLNTVTDSFTHGTAYRDSYAYPKPAIAYPFYFIFFVSIVTWGTILLFQTAKKMPSSKNRLALFLFLIFHIAAYLGAMDNFLIMADIRIFPLYPYGLYLAMPYVTIGSYLLYKIGI